MGILRKLGVAFSTWLLGSVLFLLVTTVAINRLVTQSETVKGALNDSGIYDTLVDNVLDQSEEAGDPQEASRLPLEREEVRAVTKEVFSPELLRSSSETVIDGTYRWLEGKSDKPDLRLDFTSTKADIATKLNSYLRGRVATLPACTNSAQLSASMDLFTITCKPPGVNLEPEINRITQEFSTSDNFLPDPVITADDLTLNANGQKVPAYQQLEYLPAMFQAARLLPWLFGLMALGTALIIIWLSRPHRRGFKRVAVSLITCGVFLLLGFWIFGLMADELSRRVAQTGTHTTEFVQNKVFASLIAAGERAVSGVFVTFSIVYFGIGLLIILYLWHRQRADKQPLADPAVPRSKDSDFTSV